MGKDVDKKFVNSIVMFSLVLVCLANFHTSSGYRIDMDTLFNRNLYQNHLEDNNQNDDSGEWKGRWFPDSPKGSSIDSGEEFKKIREHHRNEMLLPNVTCDDGKTNLSMDWPASYSNFICMEDYIVPDGRTYGEIKNAVIPKMYMPMHVCMDQSIEYDSTPPLFGNHRPVWPRWGEYKYLPPQRWLHNLEHGGVVMLYHPCAQSFLVEILKDVVQSCLYRHIITPYKDLPIEQPFALLVWGRGYYMPNIDVQQAVNFIRDNALKGPENISKDGIYDYKLIMPASNVTTDDSKLCPTFN